jgi:hypothetical protein
MKAKALSLYPLSSTGGGRDKVVSKQPHHFSLRHNQNSYKLISMIFFYRLIKLKLNKTNPSNSNLTIINYYFKKSFIPLPLLPSSSSSSNNNNNNNK